MDWLKLIQKILPKINWPAAIVIVAGLVFYTFVLRPDYVTAEQLREELGKYHPALDTKVSVHDTEITNLHLLHTQDEEDIREIRRRNGP